MPDNEQIRQELATAADDLREVLQDDPSYVREYATDLLAIVDKVLNK